MKKFWLSFIIVALIGTTANAALFQSPARSLRVFSCTDYCTGTIRPQVFNSRQLTACEVLTMCKAKENKCLESGGLLSRVKGRMTKVEVAIAEAEKSGVCGGISAPISKSVAAAEKREVCGGIFPPISKSVEEKSALIPPLTKEGPVVILSIDGGGVRGIVPAVMVAEIEETLQGKKISEVVDVFAGTSAGAILVSLLNIPEDPKLPIGQRTARNTAKDALGLCDVTLSKIFDTKGVRKYRVLWGMAGSKYSNKPLIETVQGEVGVNLRMNRLVKPTILTALNLTTHEPFYFNTYGKSSTYSVWEGVLASAAAPTYFKGYPLILPEGNVVKLTDGGLVSNSPQQEAFIAAKKLYPNRDYLLISLSTGSPAEKENVDVKGATAGSIPKSIKKVVESTLEAQTFKSTELLRALAKDCAQRLEYHRIEVVLPKECSSTDDASDRNVKCLKEEADKVTRGREFQNMVKRLREVAGLARPRSTAEASQEAAKKAAVKEAMAKK